MEELKHIEQKGGAPTGAPQSVFDPKESEARNLRAQKLIAKAEIERLLAKYLLLTETTNKTMAQTLVELDKIQKEAETHPGIGLFTEDEVDHLMNQFRKYRPTDTSVFPEKEQTIASAQPAMQKEQPAAVPPLSSYDKLESSWFNRKISKWLYSRPAEITEKVVREARAEKNKKLQQQTLAESYRDERPGKLMLAHGAGERDEPKQKNEETISQAERDVLSYVERNNYWKTLAVKEPKQAEIYDMPFMAEKATEDALHAYFESGLNKPELLAPLGIDKIQLEILREHHRENKAKAAQEKAEKKANRKSFFKRALIYATMIGSLFGDGKQKNSSAPSKTAPKIETVTQAKTEQAVPPKTDTTVFAETFARTQKAKPAAKQTAPTADTVQNNAPSQADTFETELMKGVINERSMEIPGTSVIASADTAATPAADTEKAPQASVEKIRIEPATILPVKTLEATPVKEESKLMDAVRKADLRDKEREQKKKTPTQEIPASELARGPQIPGGLAPAPTIAPEATGRFSPGAEKNNTTTTTHGIKLVYTDKNGNPEGTTPEIKITPMPEKKNTNQATSSVEKNTGSAKTEAIVSPKETVAVTRPESIASPIKPTKPTREPIVFSPASSTDSAFYFNKIPLNQMERGEHIPVPEGWNFDPIDRTMTVRKGGFKKEGWNIHEYRVKDIDGYKNMPYFLWKKIDPTLWDAFKEVPGALDKYIKNTEREGSQDPYVIQLWKGNTATEYIINSIGRPAAPAQERKAEHPNFGKIIASIKKIPGQTTTFTVSGQNYSSLTELDKNVLNLTVTQPGKETFTVYSFNADQVAGGGQVFQGDELVMKEVSQIKKEIQDELIRVRAQTLIPLHPVENTVLQDGKTVIKVQWMPDEMPDLTHRDREVKIERKKNLFKKRTNPSATIQNRTTPQKKIVKKQKKAVVYDYSQQP